MNTIWHWIYPGLYGIVAYFFVRLISEYPFKGLSHEYLSAGLVLMCVISYLVYFACRFYFSKKWTLTKGIKESICEYTLFILFIALLVNGLLLSFHVTGLNVMGNVDHSLLIANFVTISLFLLYYTMVRNQEMGKYYRLQAIQLEKIKNDQLDTELNFLKAQYHPHFLFNALNTVYFQVDDSNTAARESIELLSGLLRYQLYDINQQVMMEKEINYLDSYIQFQQLRTSERLQLDLYIDPELKREEIHPLLFQPLVENGFKYVGGEYKMAIRLSKEGKRIHFYIRNSVSGRKKSGKAGGIGITNLQRRLELLYPGKYNLEIEELPESFGVLLSIELE